MEALPSACPWDSFLNKRSTWSHRAALFLYSFASYGLLALAINHFLLHQGQSFHVTLPSGPFRPVFQMLQRVGHFNLHWPLPAIAALGSVYIFWHHFSS